MNNENLTKTNMVVPTCPYCNEKFTRQEHVDRHIRSHTNEKPFQCKTCQKCFSRRDLLTRHEKGHSGPGLPTIKTTSVRAPTACLNCAASKQKCTGEQNCDRCQKKGVECTFPEGGAKKKSFRPQLMHEMTSHFQSVEVDQNLSRSSYNVENPEMYARDYNTHMSMSPTTTMGDFDPPLRGSPGHFHHPQSDQMAPMYYDMYGIDSTGPLSMMDPTYSMVFCQDMVAGNLNDLLMNVFDDNSSVEDSGAGSYSDFTTPHHSPHIGSSMLQQFGPQETSGSFTAGLHSAYSLNSSAIRDSHGSRYTVPPVPAPTILRSVPEKFSEKAPVREPSPPESLPAGRQDDGEDIIMKHSAAFDSSSMVWKAPDRNTNTILEGLTTEKSLKPIPTRPKIVLSKEVDAIPKVTTATRDRLVSIWSKTVRGPWQDIELVFPTLGFFQDMLESFFMHFHPQYPIIHLPTFDPNTALPHLLGTMIAIGTIWSCGLPEGTFEERELRAAASGSIGGIGVGLLECSRRAMQHLIESDNRSIRQIDAQQASFLVYISGTWSGVKRQMELGQAFCQTLFTMCRGSDRFQNRDFLPLQVVLHDSSFASVEARWDHWIRAERRKRFVYCLIIWDAQIGAQFQLSPFLQPGEMALPIPASDALWYAETAQEWHTKALAEVTAGRAGSEPSFANFSGRLMFHDTSDVLMSHYTSSSALLKVALLASLRSTVYEFRKMQNSLDASHPSHEQSVNRRKRKRQSEACPLAAHKMTSLSLQYTYLCDLLQTCENVCQIRQGSTDVETDIVTLLTIHNHALELNCSFNSILTLAGRVNAAEAKRVLPILLRWVDEEEARRATWHAGQILALCRLSTKHKRVMHALPLILFHACLALWAYGLLDTVSMAGVYQSPRSQNFTHDLVFLDQPQNNAVRSFIKTKQGTPVLSSALVLKTGQNDGEKADSIGQYQDSAYVTLDKQEDVMEVCRDLMLSIDGGGSLACDLANLLELLGTSGTNLIDSYRRMKRERI